MPPGYPAAYFYGLQYGNPAANAQSVYQPTMNVPAGAGSASSQYQKQYKYDAILMLTFVYKFCKFLNLS